MTVREACKAVVQFVVKHGEDHDTSLSDVFSSCLNGDFDTYFFGCIGAILNKGCHNASTEACLRKVETEETASLSFRVCLAISVIRRSPPSSSDKNLAAFRRLLVEYRNGGGSDVFEDLFPKGSKFLDVYREEFAPRSTAGTNTRLSIDLTVGGTSSPADRDRMDTSPVSSAPKSSLQSAVASSASTSSAPAARGVAPTASGSSLGASGTASKSSGITSKTEPTSATVARSSLKDPPKSSSSVSSSLLGLDPSLSKAIAAMKEKPSNKLLPHTHNSRLSADIQDLIIQTAPILSSLEDRNLYVILFGLGRQGVDEDPSVSADAYSLLQRGGGGFNVIRSNPERIVGHWHKLGLSDAESRPGQALHVVLGRGSIHNLKVHDFHMLGMLATHSKEQVRLSFFRAVEDGVYIRMTHLGLDRKDRLPVALSFISVVLAYLGLPLSPSMIEEITSLENWGDNPPPARPDFSSQTLHVLRLPIAVGVHSWPKAIDILCSPERSHLTPSSRKYLRKDAAPPATSSGDETAVVGSGAPASAPASAPSSVAAPAPASAPRSSRPTAYAVIDGNGIMRPTAASLALVPSTDSLRGSKFPKEWEQMLRNSELALIAVAQLAGLSSSEFLTAQALLGLLQEQSRLLLFSAIQQRETLCRTLEEAGAPSRAKERTKTAERYVQDLIALQELSDQLATSTTTVKGSARIRSRNGSPSFMYLDGPGVRASPDSQDPAAGGSISLDASCFTEGNRDHLPVGVEAPSASGFTRV